MIPVRQDLAWALGATESVAEHGEPAGEAVLELTGDVGTDATLGCDGSGRASG